MTDADIRSRLAQGDEDSIVNFMLFGVTFTKQPRATARDVARVGEGKTIADVVAARLEDLVAGIATPGGAHATHTAPKARKIAFSTTRRDPSR